MVATTDEVHDTNEVSASEVQVTPATEMVISEEDFEKAQKTFQLGKKNLFLNKYDESVNNIDEACKIYSTKYGEFGPQCAEVYFFYGRALLELARVENTVLGNALTGVPEDTGPIDDSRYGNPEDVAADEKKEISDKVIDALCPDEVAVETTKTDVEMTTGETKTTETTEGEKQAETTTTTTTEAAPAMAEGEVTKKTTEGETAATAEATTTAATTTEEGGEEGEDEGEDDEEEDEAEGEEGEDITKNDEQAKDEAEAEDISNLQRSWEMFELAKLVYSKNFENDMSFKNKRVAECLLKLGEISIEQESYEQAIIDITESIKLQEEQTKEQRDERMLAESFYQLGLAQQFNNLFTESNESYQKSINIMQMRVEMLKGKLTGMTGEDADTELEKTTVKDEISELEALLPEMIGKLEEVQQGQQSLTLIKEAKECFINTMTTNEASMTTATAAGGEVKDITSMVKSKRKVSESPVAENGSEMKKTKVCDEANGGGETTKIEVDTAVVTNADAIVTENKENQEMMMNTAVETTTKTMDEKPMMGGVDENGKVAEQITEAVAEITA